MPTSIEISSANTRRILLPKIICGEVRHAKPGDEVTVLRYEDDIVVEIPTLTEADVEAIVANRTLLDDIPIGAVTDFLGNAGRKMLDERDPLRNEAIAHGTLVSGFTREMFESDYTIMGTYLSKRHLFYALLDGELGDHHILDEWIRNQVGRIRAFPRGRALHIMVGNVPLASMFSAMRSILTKNQTLIKIPSRDPVTSTYFALLMLAANKPSNPLSRAISCFYADKDSPCLDHLKRSSDVICAWGKGSALEEIKRTIPHSIPYLEFGPKRSLSVLFSADANLRAAAMKLAHDVSVYDQEACFSPQRLFVIGEVEPFLTELRGFLDVFARALPKGRTNMDAESYLLRTRSEARYRGWEVHASAEWTVIVADPHDVVDHPLSRTLFVHRIDSLDEIVPFVDDETQTITVQPYRHAEKVADVLCPHGAQRICESGMVASPRGGFTHDGMYPLHYFVRIAHLDESVNYVNNIWDKAFFTQYYHKVFGSPEIADFGRLMMDQHVDDEETQP